MSQGIYIDPTSKRPEPAGEAFRVIPAENGYVIRYGGSYYNMAEEKIAVATNGVELLQVIRDILHVKRVSISAHRDSADEAPF
jgi:hypothetical protein